MTENIGLYFVGDALADQRADPDNPRKLIVTLGGSMYFGSTGAANAIKNLGLDHVKSFYVGPIPEDFFGGLITDDFKTVGVGMEYSRPSPFLNRMSVVSEDGKGGNKYSVYMCSQAVPPLTLEQLPTSFHEPKRIFTFGSVNTTLSANGQVLKEFAKIQTAQGAIALYDPNTRPNAIPDTAAYRVALEDWIKTVTVAKASEEDIEFAYPELTYDELARHWLSLGPKAIFITHGGKGCSVYHGGDTAHIEPLNNPLIKRTVGAGDNFNAGIVIGLVEQNITGSDQLNDKDINFWRGIATRANSVAYQHLLRVNNIEEVISKAS